MPSPPPRPPRRRRRAGHRCGSAVRSHRRRHAARPIRHRSTRPSLFEPSPAAPTDRRPYRARRRRHARSSRPRRPRPCCPGCMLDAKELCSMSGLTAAQLAELISYGVLASDSVSGASTYNDDALAIATNAKRFLDAGVDARHLRGWRVAAEREAGLLDQLVQPLVAPAQPRSTGAGDPATDRTRSGRRAAAFGDDARGPALAHALTIRKRRLPHSTRGE